MFKLLKMSNLCVDCAFCCVTALCFCICVCELSWSVESEECKCGNAVTSRLNQKLTFN